VVIGRGNPDYKPVEIRISVPVKEKNLTDQVLIGESGTFPWLPAKRSLKQRQCRSNLKKELEAHDFSRGRMSHLSHSFTMGISRLSGS